MGEGFRVGKMPSWGPGKNKNVSVSTCRRCRSDARRFHRPAFARSERDGQAAHAVFRDRFPLMTPELPFETAMSLPALVRFSRQAKSKRSVAKPIFEMLDGFFRRCPDDRRLGEITPRRTGDFFETASCNTSPRPTTAFRPFSRFGAMGEVRTRRVFAAIISVGRGSAPTFPSLK